MKKIRGFVLAMLLCCPLPGMAEGGFGEPLVLEMIERHAPLHALFATDPELARAIARRLLMEEDGGNSGEDAGDEADPALEGDATGKGSSPEAVLDLIEIMKRAARAQTEDTTSGETP